MKAHTGVEKHYMEALGAGRGFNAFLRQIEFMQIAEAYLLWLLVIMLLFMSNAKTGHLCFGL